MALLEVKDLHTCFRTKKGILNAVNGVSYELEAGKTLGIVGESGCGKSISAMSILKLLPSNGFIESGSITYQGNDLTRYKEKEMNRIRGNEISVIFQEPMTSLNPVLTVERQLMEPLQLHQGMNRHQARQQAIELLMKVRIPNPETIAKGYAHLLSGGMRQRVMIAMALACNPGILIADEPTTALDVTIQAQILKLMNELKSNLQTGILFITHDLGVIRKMADQVVVMYCGQIVEYCEVEQIFKKNAYQHPYTQGLLASLPSIESKHKSRLSTIDGTLPSPYDLPEGCTFAPRCPYATKECQTKQPELELVEERHWIRCFYPNKEERRG